MNKNKILIFTILWFTNLILYQCNTNKHNIRGNSKTKVESGVQLGIIEKIEIPRIEKKENKIKVLIWGKRPSIYSEEKETIIEKTETGYSIKIIFQPSEEKKEINFYKEVYIQISKSGGYDIEVIGEKNSIIDIVYIDE